MNHFEKQTTYNSPLESSAKVIIAAVVNSHMLGSSSDRHFVGAEENRQNGTIPSNLAVTVVMQGDT